ncbi:hypothetical protein RFI_33162 [Reticulomyxa filosa]|uniref:Uncharacterized protein n=1 Tax=Reticulomyxa filosa TaxID=46433 RepID=X6LU31_RETFI|nr:hypothetical protein RFI_33162 [Reticulomyxa filosa]|eukprot:ETO04240.1 hypothetical protein RFI_33162 [Reticulomyxa filosa]
MRLSNNGSKLEKNSRQNVSNVMKSAVETSEQANNNDKYNELKMSGGNKGDKEVKEKEDKKKIKKSNNKAAITTNDYNMVMAQVKEVQTCDLENLLQIHEPQFLHFRDTIYQQAASTGIHQQSSDKHRLKVVQKVVQWYNKKIFFFLRIKKKKNSIKQVRSRNSGYENLQRNQTKSHIDFNYILLASWCVYASTNMLNIKSKKRGQETKKKLFVCAKTDAERFIPCIKCDYLPEVSILCALFLCVKSFIFVCDGCST